MGKQSLTQQEMKYLIVTGGVLSGLGKGITISSLGLLLQSHGVKVTSIKIDPYLVRSTLNETNRIELRCWNNEPLRTW